MQGLQGLQMLRGKIRYQTKNGSEMKKDAPEQNSKLTKCILRFNWLIICNNYAFMEVQ